VPGIFLLVLETLFQGMSQRLPPSGGSGSGATSTCSPCERSVSLSSPNDSDWLSPALCLLRSQIECFAYTATAAAPASDPKGTAKAPGRGGGRGKGNRPTGGVVIGQVGIRCRWCKHVPRHDRARGSELFPSNIGLIHQAVRNYQRYVLGPVSYTHLRAHET